MEQRGESFTILPSHGQNRQDQSFHLRRWLFDHQRAVPQG
jgi:hypothetical protein